MKNPDFSNEAEWKEFVEGLAAAKPWAYELFWEQYGQRLEAVAAKHFPAGLSRRMGPQDIVQSTCRSFFTRIVDGRLKVSDNEGLWALLCAITLNKTRLKQRYHLAQRRAINRERDLDSDKESKTEPVEKSSPSPSPDDMAVFTEQLEKVMEKLDPLERQVLHYKLEDYTHEEIAEKIQRSDRTIRRLVVRIQEKLQGQFSTEESEA
jgi:RNA polymerase sigma-70 factor, ECF subfamily